MPGYISKMATKTTKEKCRYGERFLYCSPCCDTCLLNCLLNEQANYCSSNSLICPKIKSIYRKFLAVLEALFPDDAAGSGSYYM